MDMERHMLIYFFIFMFFHEYEEKNEVIVKWR